MRILTVLSVVMRQVGSSQPFPCTTELDCSLNGDCVRGRCDCDAAWTGSEACDVLAILDQPDGGPLGYYNGSYSSWGGNVVEVDGQYHLLVAQFVEHCELGDWGSNSAVIRATAADPAGPFSYQQTVLPPFAHNPTVRALPNGAGFVLYMIGGTPSTPKNCTVNSTAPQSSSGQDQGSRTRTPPPPPPDRSSEYSTDIRVSFAPAIDGPWSVPIRVNFTDRSGILFKGGYNPSPHVHPNGSVTLALQLDPGHKPDLKWEMVGVAHATSWRGPFTLLSPNPITPGSPLCVAGREEDPFLWQSKRGWHILTHGMCPTGVLQAHHRFSLDARTWHHSKAQTYPYSIRYTNGTTHLYARVERPQLHFSTFDAVTGTFDDPTTLYNGVCEGFQCLTVQTGVSHTLARPLLSRK